MVPLETPVSPLAPMNLILTDTGDNCLTRWIGQSYSTIESSSGDRFDLSSSACYQVGDRVAFSHPDDTCGWSSGVGVVSFVQGSQIELSEVERYPSPTPGGDATGQIFKVVDMTGWIAILAIYSHFETDPSPPNLKGAIDKGSNILLTNSEDIRPGDKVWLNEAGISGATAKTVQSVTSGGKTYRAIALSQTATAAVLPTAPKAVTRRGQLLSYTKIRPTDREGLMGGCIDRREILSLPSADQCDCDPCSSMRHVGCYQLMIARGEFAIEGRGYRLYYGDNQSIVEQGQVYIQQSVVPALESITV